MVTQVSRKRPYHIRSVDQLVGPTLDQYHEVIANHHYKTLWSYAASAILGVWLITAPHLYDYQSAPLAWSDTISGVVVLMAELLSFSPNRYLMRWLTPMTAAWLLFAPLIFWAPNAATYLSDTLIACALISFSLLIPGIPGQAAIEKAGPDMPPQWSYNPSSWIRRWLGIALALLGFFISRYLAARQLGYTAHAFDPFFGNGSEHVLHSGISRAFPISDAGFGSVAYMLEVVAGFLGDRARWRTSPWVVTSFALLVVPLGATSIVLVILQPMAVGYWCGLCLIAAVALLTSVPLAVHEIIAMALFLKDAQSQGRNVWDVFWRGAAIIGEGNEDPSRRNWNLSQRYIASIQGITIPWMLFVQMAIGIWLMARPDIIHFTRASANVDHLVGALILTVAAVATAEVTRTVRWLNIPLGVVLIACAFMFAMHMPSVFWSELICGLVLVPVSLPRGEIIEHYDGWDRFVL